MRHFDVVIVGAGASGLVAARVLSKSGKKVLILEARGRLGGRIWSLAKDKLGPEAEAGAEFVHGEAPITRSLMDEAKLEYLPSQGEKWSLRDGNLKLIDDFMVHRDVFLSALTELKQDLPLGDFLDKYFSGELFTVARNAVRKMVEGYDAADVSRISTFALRDEWLGQSEWVQGRIAGGYKPLVEFLESEIKKYNSEILLEQDVSRVSISDDGVKLQSKSGEEFYSKVTLITVPVSVLNRIEFIPSAEDKVIAASNIGFGGAIKILIRFENVWWNNSLGKDLSRMSFILTNGIVAAWWTQYPNKISVLTGWIAGPITEELKDKIDEEILDVSIESLSNEFNLEKNKLKDQIVDYQVANWSADPYSHGAYSYASMGAIDNVRKLRRPIENKVFFAGEALYSGKETATVEGAFASGMEVTKDILGILN